MKTIPSITPRKRCGSLLTFLAAIGISASAAPAAPVNNVGIALNPSQFGTGQEIHLASGSAKLLLPSQAYSYQVVGTCRGTGALAAIVPPNTPISTFIGSISSGAAAKLAGIVKNPTGSLPVSNIINRSFSGTRTVPGLGSVDIALTLHAEITSTGEVRFDLTNVSFTSNPVTDLGTIQFEAGSSLQVGTSPLIGFKKTSWSVNENGTKLTMTIRRYGNGKGAVTAKYATVPMTADSGDFTPTSGTATFADGKTTYKFDIPLKNNTKADGKRKFAVVLSAPGGGALVDTKAKKATVTIKDDEAP